MSKKKPENYEHETYYRHVTPEVEIEVTRMTAFIHEEDLTEAVLSSFPPEMRDTVGPVAKLTARGFEQAPKTTSRWAVTIQAAGEEPMELLFDDVELRALLDAVRLLQMSASAMQLC